MISRLNRFIALVLVPALLADPGTALALSEVEGAAFAKKGAVPGPIAIPARYGRITDYYAARPESCVLSRESNTATLARDAGPKTQDPRLVVLIQDLHGHPGVQRNIAEILKQLSRHASWVVRRESRTQTVGHTTHDTRLRTGNRYLTVFVEGASGPFDVSLLRNVPDPWVKKKAVEHFLNDLKLTGAEIAAIESNAPMHLWGVDDKALYLKNLEAFYQASSPPVKDPLPPGGGGRGWGGTPPSRHGESPDVLATSPARGEGKAWSPIPHPKHPAWQEYYDIAKERDIPLTLNALAHLDLLAKGYRQTLPPSPVHHIRGLPMSKEGCSWAGPLSLEGEGGGEGVVALVAGGYHTEGISRLLRANSIAYVVVAPTVRELGYERLYTQTLASLARSAREQTLAMLLLLACRHWLPTEAQAMLGAIAAYLFINSYRGGDEAIGHHFKISVVKQAVQAYLDKVDELFPGWRFVDLERSQERSLMPMVSMQPPNLSPEPKPPGTPTLRLNRRGFMTWAAGLPFLVKGVADRSWTAEPSPDGESKPPPFIPEIQFAETYRGLSPTAQRIIDIIDRESRAFYEKHVESSEGVLRWKSREEKTAPQAQIRCYEFLLELANAVSDAGLLDDMVEQKAMTEDQKKALKDWLADEAGGVEKLFFFYHQVLPAYFARFDRGSFFGPVDLLKDDKSITGYVVEVRDVRREGVEKKGVDLLGRRKVRIELRPLQPSKTFGYRQLIPETSAASTPDGAVLGLSHHIILLEDPRDRSIDRLMKDVGRLFEADKTIDFWQTHDGLKPKDQDEAFGIARYHLLGDVVRVLGSSLSPRANTRRREQLQKDYDRMTQHGLATYVDDNHDPTMRKKIVANPPHSYARARLNELYGSQYPKLSLYVLVRSLQESSLYPGFLKDEPLDANQYVLRTLLLLIYQARWEDMQSKRRRRHYGDLVIGDVSRKAEKREDLPAEAQLEILAQLWKLSDRDIRELLEKIYDRLDADFAPPKEQGQPTKIASITGRLAPASTAKSAARHAVWMLVGGVALAAYLAWRHLDGLYPVLIGLWSVHAAAFGTSYSVVGYRVLYEEFRRVEEPPAGWRRTLYRRWPAAYAFVEDFLRAFRFGDTRPIASWDSANHRPIIHADLPPMYELAARIHEWCHLLEDLLDWILEKLSLHRWRAPIAGKSRLVEFFANAVMMMAMPLLVAEVTVLKRRGLTIGLHWSIALGLGYAFRMFNDVFDFAPPYSGPLWSLTGALFLLVYVGIHELAHAWAAQWRGVPLQGIKIGVLGGMTTYQYTQNFTGKDESAVAAAGPASSLALFGLLWLMYAFTVVGSDEDRVVTALLFTTGILTFGNLAPFLLLDGGRILRALLWWRTGDFAKATRLSVYIFRAVVLGLAGASYMGWIPLDPWWTILPVLLALHASGELELLQLRTQNNLPGGDSPGSASGPPPAGGALQSHPEGAVYLAKHAEAVAQAVVAQVIAENSRGSGVWYQPRSPKHGSRPAIEVLSPSNNEDCERDRQLEKWVFPIVRPVTARRILVLQEDQVREKAPDLNVENLPRSWIQRVPSDFVDGAIGGTPDRSRTEPVIVIRQSTYEALRQGDPDAHEAVAHEFVHADQRGQLDSASHYRTFEAHAMYKGSLPAWRRRLQKLLWQPWNWNWNRAVEKLIRPGDVSLYAEMVRKAFRAALHTCGLCFWRFWTLPDDALFANNTPVRNIVSNYLGQMLPDDAVKKLILQGLQAHPDANPGPGPDPTGQPDAALGQAPNPSTRSMSEAQRRLEAEQEETHFWFQGRRAILRALAQAHPPFVPHQPGGPIRLLDIGAGTGRIARMLQETWRRLSSRDVRAYALEPDPHDAVRMKTLPLDGIVAADGRKLPFADDTFEAISAFDVAEHVEDDEALLQEIHRVLKPGGLAYLAVPAFRKHWSRHDEVLGHYRRYDPGELEEKLVRAGFDIVYAGFAVALVYPLFWLARTLSRAKRHEPVTNDSTDLALAPPEDAPVLRTLYRIAHRILEAVLVLEAWWIGRGFHFRIPGVSRVVVARKPPLQESSQRTSLTREDDAAERSRPDMQHARPASLQGKGTPPLLETLLGTGAIPSVLDVGTGIGDWMRAIQGQPLADGTPRQRPRWLAKQAQVTGYDLEHPRVYHDEVFAPQSDPELWVRPERDWRGLTVAHDLEALLEGSFHLIHEAFMDQGAPKQRFDMYHRLLANGGWLVFAHADCVLSRKDVLTWLAARGYSYTLYEQHQVPSDYPVTFWWRWYSARQTNYLIVARKVSR